MSPHPPGGAAQPNIILTGFMGTGKTTVGQEIARRLGRSFLDVDTLITARAGKSVPDIFAQDGEAAFRALEAAVCQEMRTPAGLVIATGGGAMLNEANRAALAAGGTIICLDAAPETIAARLEGQEGRPLLAGQNERAARIEALLARRAPAYDALPHHLDTDPLTVAAAAERAMAIAEGLPAGGHLVPVNRGSGSAALAGYDVLIAPGVLAQAGRHLAAAGLTPGRCAVVTNPTLAAHHLATLTQALAAAGFEARVFEVPDGEAYKTLATAGTLYEQCAADRMARGEPVIALGGGVIGDLTGFVASTWLRGVPFVQVPTSLLSMVDASVGGKVAVDLPQGKNLVGAFKQPAAVLIDPQVLATLPAAEYRAGLAEVLKTGIVGDPTLFAWLASEGGPQQGGPQQGGRRRGAPEQAGDLASLTAMLAATVRFKVGIVERDPFEEGDRAWLNLGHTFGHALELLSEFRLRHGEAVALGLVAAAELSHVLQCGEADLPVRVAAAVERLGLPVRYAFDPAAALAAMGTDKKRRGRTLRFIVPTRIGEVRILENVPERAVLAALAAIRTA